MKDLRMLVTLLKRKVYHTKGMIPTYTHGLTDRIELRHAHTANTRLPRESEPLTQREQELANRSGSLSRSRRAVRFAPEHRYHSVSDPLTRWQSRSIPVNCAKRIHRHALAVSAWRSSETRWIR